MVIYVQRSTIHQTPGCSEYLIFSFDCKIRCLPEALLNILLGIYPAAAGQNRNGEIREQKYGHSRRHGPCPELEPGGLPGVRRHCGGGDETVRRAPVAGTGDEHPSQSTLWQEL